jgi:hypothetical protein
VRLGRSGADKNGDDEIFHFVRSSLFCVRGRR